MKKSLWGLLLLIVLAVPVQAAGSDGLRQAMIESCREGVSLDVSAYNLTGDALEDVFWELYQSGQFPWYVDRQFHYNYEEGTNHAVDFTPVLLDESRYDRNLYERTVAEILDATVHQGMEPWQIALSVHDYLVAHFAYDETLTRHKGYDLLVDGTAVCDGYTEAYMDLMNRAGVECIVVVSEEMGGEGHAWNLVKLGESWYHVDLTWDDPTPNCQGQVRHDYFLKTDEELLTGEKPHYGWQTDITCTDTAYSDGFWNGVTSQICYPDAKTSYLRTQEDWTGYICSRNEDTAEQTVLYIDTEKYINLGPGEYTYQHQGLSLWNGRLWFSGMDAVYSMEPDGSDLRTEYRYDAEGNGKYICGSFVDGGVIRLTLSDHGFNLTGMEVPLTGVDSHVHSYVPQRIPATCLEDGMVVYRCECGITYNGGTIEATGHCYGNTVVRRPTLFQNGLRRYDCRDCGDSYTEDIPRLTILQWLTEALGSLMP